MLESDYCANNAVVILLYECSDQTTVEAARKETGDGSVASSTYSFFDGIVKIIKDIFELN